MNLLYRRLIFYFKMGILILKRLSKGKPAVVRSPSSFVKFLVLEETNQLPPKYKTYCGASYCLVDEVPMEKIWQALKGQKEIEMNTADLLALIEYHGNPALFTCSNIGFVEEACNFGLNFFIKKTNDRERRSLYYRVWKSRHPNLEQLCLVVKSRKVFTTDGFINVQSLVLKDISEKKTFFCEQCSIPISRRDALTRHENNPTACSTETTVKPISKPYGAPVNTPAELFEAGFIKEEHLTYKQDWYGVFDIETSETLTDDHLRERAILSTLSISFMTSRDDKPMFFVREGDLLEDGKQLVHRFLVEVEKKAAAFSESVPKIFFQSLEKILAIEAARREEWKQRQQEGIPSSDNKLVLFPAAWKAWLRSMTTFRIYGFNSSRFDARVLAPALFDIVLNELQTDNQKEKRKNKIDVLKRQTSYFNLSFKLPGSASKIQFVDILNYLSPCNLAQFLAMTGAPDAKGIYPYQHFKTVADLKAATEFPPMEAFYSALKSGLTCDEASYAKAKALFEERQKLPANHPDKMDNMLDYLEFYNNQDVGPLVIAIKSWFDSFEEIFGIDGFQYSSLASMASNAMFKQFDSEAPLLHSLPPWKMELSQKIKESVVGGLCTTLHRAVLLDGSEGPQAAKKAPNGDDYTSVIPFDFNRYIICYFD